MRVRNIDQDPDSLHQRIIADDDLGFTQAIIAQRQGCAQFASGSSSAKNSQYGFHGGITSRRPQVVSFVCPESVKLFSAES